jgi:hypothetical protein
MRTVRAGRRLSRSMRQCRRSCDGTLRCENAKSTQAARGGFAMGKDDAEIRIYEEDLVAQLESDDGRQIEVAIVAELDYKGHTYVACHPTDAAHYYSDILEMVIDEDGTTTYLTIDDEDLYHEVFQVFSEKFEEVFWSDDEDEKK